MPCLWPIDTSCAGDDWNALDPAIQDRALLLASSSLHRLTGGRVAVCPITVRPCTSRRGLGIDHNLPWYSGFAPYPNASGAWVNACGCSYDCTCYLQLCEVRLPRPVGEVREVRVDGAVLPVTDYRVVDNRVIYTAGESCPWNLEQDLALPDTEPGTFSITYLPGHPVDAVGRCVAGILAMEFARAARGGKCRLPSGVTAVTRQGVTMEVSQGAFPNGVTGIREVDAYIALWNPSALTSGARVWSPDIR